MPEKRKLDSPSPTGEPGGSAVQGVRQWKPSQLRYQKRRAQVLAAAKVRHEMNSASPSYRALIATRKQISNAKRSIEIYRDKITDRKNEIARLKRKQESLELQWGSERAARKRARCGR